MTKYPPMTIPKQYRRAFCCQRATAKNRGIEFKLTDQEWLTWWGSDLQHRGKSRNALQMGRLNDSGAYELGNIYKVSLIDNLKEPSAVKNRRVSTEPYYQSFHRPIIIDTGEEFADLQTAADHLGVHLETVRRRVRSGKYSIKEI